jgi:hypothetical protein
MNSIQPEDSLDNLSNLHLNRQRQLLAQVKQLFSRGLEKLQMADTREIVTHCRSRASQNSRNSSSNTGTRNTSGATSPSSRPSSPTPTVPPRSTKSWLSPSLPRPTDSSCSTPSTSLPRCSNLLSGWWKSSTATSTTTVRPSSRHALGLSSTSTRTAWATRTPKLSSPSFTRPSSVLPNRCSHSEVGSR